MGLTTPRLFGHAVDQVVAELKSADHAGFLQALMITAALVIGASAVRGILTGLGGYQGEKVSQKVAYQLRLDFFQQLQRLPFGFHDKIHSGDLITRGMIDLEGARMFIQNGMLQSVTLVLLLFGASALMIAEDWRMAALGLMFVPIAIFALGRMGFLLRVTWMRVQQLMSVLTLTMEENLQGVRVVRAFAASDFEMAKFDKAAAETLAYSYKRIVLRMRAVTTMTISFLWLDGPAALVRRPPDRGRDHDGRAADRDDLLPAAAAGADPPGGDDGDGRGAGDHLWRAAVRDPRYQAGDRRQAGGPSPRADAGQCSGSSMWISASTRASWCCGMSASPSARARPWASSARRARASRPSPT